MFSRLVTRIPIHNSVASLRLLAQPPVACTFSPRLFSGTAAPPMSSEATDEAEETQEVALEVPVSGRALSSRCTRDDSVPCPRAQVLEKGGFILKAKEVPVSAKKMHLIAKQLAGLSLPEATVQMALSEKRVAKTRIKQLMDSAWYVAENHHNLDPTTLVIKEAWTSKDKYLMRIMYHSKGRAGRKERPRTTLTVRLETADGQTAAKASKHNGQIKYHWKRWKGKLDGLPKRQAVEGVGAVE